MVTTGTFALTPDVARTLQGIAARGEALQEGVFRSGPVGIAGTAYRPPSGDGLAVVLERSFLKMAESAARLANPYERGMAVFLHVARSQSFWDGNKRTGRLLMNGVLLAAGQDIITVPAERRLDYNQKMLAFYESGDGTEMMKFLSILQIRSRFE